MGCKPRDVSSGGPQQRTRHVSLIVKCLGLGEVGLPALGSRSSPNHCQGLCLCFFRDLHEILRQIDREVAFPTPIEGRDRSERPPSEVKFCTVTPKIWQYYHLLLRRATTTAVQMAAPVPENIDTTS
jgi:hypothetical protein